MSVRTPQSSGSEKGHPQATPRELRPPVIVAVDDDPTALANIERELRERYAGHYHVLCTDSPAEARTILIRLAVAGE